MKKISIYSILSLLFLCCACSSTKNGLLGKYQKEILPFYSNVTLNKNNTCSYYVHTDSYGSLSVIGEWKRSEDTIIFDFKDVPQKLIRGNLKINYSSKKNKDSITIKIVNIKGEPMIGRTLILNDVEKYIPVNGEISLNPMFVEKISFRDFDTENLISLNINKDINVNFIVTVEPNIERELVYDLLPEKLLPKNNKLYSFTEKDTILIDYPYIKLGNGKGR